MLPWQTLGFSDKKHVQTCINLINCSLISIIFHSYGGVTITGERLQNLGLCSVRRASKQGGIFILPHLLQNRVSGFPVSFEGLKAPFSCLIWHARGVLRTYSDPEHQGSLFSRLLRHARTWGLFHKTSNSWNCNQELPPIVKFCKTDDSIWNSWHKNIFIKSLKLFSNQRKLENNERHLILVVVISPLVKRGPCSNLDPHGLGKG
jgi:hypothetical protein